MLRGMLSKCKSARRFGSLLHRFTAARRGTVAIFLAAAIVPLVGFMGLATDGARAYLVKSRLGEALDAAGLAGGQAVLETTFEDDITMFFDANFPPGYLGATVALAPPTVDANNEIITLTATATVDTTFMRIFGIHDITVGATTEVTRKTQLLDVVLAIDVSGSMSWSDGSGSTRIAAARGAATDLVDILFGEDETKELLNIGLVPWNAKVNVTLDGFAYDPANVTSEAVPNFTNPYTGGAQSELFYSDISPVPLFSTPAAGWQGCAYARYVDDADDSNDADVLLGPVSTGGTDWVGWQAIEDEGEPTGSCSWCTQCYARGITPLGNVKSTITNAISNLTNPTGSTNIPQGLAWAWRALTPGEPFAEAVADPEGARTQAIVLLTDGENWGYYGDAYDAAFGIGSSAGANGLNDRLRLLADNIKAQGVKIYVIQFYYNSGTLQSLMQDVASEPNAPFYNFAPDGAALSQVFNEVANNLSELRLSK